ncbi:MAG: bifunctional transaldolase/phosoglucose isomerase [Chloroflexi bacterium]|nr:bifunctional transaldolase/phosoglucose isomerase [Chloroflexota bacterium]
MSTNPLLDLKQLGQSIWLDSIRRSHITSGGLKKLIDDDGVAGETSNPNIFEKAIAGSHDYDDDVRDLIAAGKRALEIYETLAIKDVQTACDVFRPVYDATQGGDGFVSLEVSPKLAYDTAGTIAEAKRFFKAVNRPNVMIKIPGTPAGVPAVEECLYSGLNVNVTLLFAVEAYEQVAWAYVRALERRAAEGKPIDRIASVASFFVSRIDTLGDKLLADKMKATTDPALQAKLEALGGKAAIANAKLAYQLFKKIFGDARFIALKSKGARVQRPLWASTSTKNPNYPDVLYVETLIGPDTINTLPLETIDAYRDHGKPRVTIEDAIPGALRVLQDLSSVGIRMQAITDQVLDEGVVKFDQAFDQLLGSIEAKITAAANARHSANLGKFAREVDEALRVAQNSKIVPRIWQKDPAVWKAKPAEQHEIVDRLGWLTVATEMRKNIADLRAFSDEVKRAGYKSVVLCGMGGSSLCVETLRDTLGVARGFPKMFVLDTTDPATIRALERKLDVKRTLFIIASKSGGTVETSSHYKYFAKQVSAQSFVAITDAGTSLDQLAQAQGFRHVFRNPADIGGRYSALSFFGLVPAALMGIDLDRLLTRAEEMARACASDANPGLWLGVVWGALAKHKRDKITVITSRGLETFGAWAEQLIAESTGKEGKGLTPVDGEPLAPSSQYGDDRVFVYLRLAGAKNAALDRKVTALEEAGQPVVRLHMRDVYDVGAEFFRWEFATAVAGAQIGINAFDQPNVQESKDNTKRVLATKKPKAEKPVWKNKQFEVFATEKMSKVKTLRDVFRAFMAHAQPNDYFALMAYVERSPKNHRALQAIRVGARRAGKLATTLGFGPRFLHSTGQLHKGGANTVLGLQIVADDAADAKIPGEAYSFGALKRAQALGDWQALQSHKRRALRVRVKRGGSLAQLAKEFVNALKERK